MGKLSLDPIMVSMDDVETCSACDGVGRIMPENPYGRMTCWKCAGTGRQLREIKQERKYGMNYSTAVMALNENIRAIRASYEPEIRDNSGKVIKAGQFYVFRTLDHTIKPGDLVVVPSTTRHNFTTVKVEEVDVEVDLESDTVLKWIVAKVPLEPYKALLDEEAKWVEQLKKADKLAKKNEIKKKMLDMYQGVDISTLAIATLKDSSDLLKISAGHKDGCDEEKKKK